MIAKSKRNVIKKIKPTIADFLIVLLTLTPPYVFDLLFPNSAFCFPYQFLQKLLRVVRIFHGFSLACPLPDFPLFSGEKWLLIFSLEVGRISPNRSVHQYVLICCLSSPMPFGSGPQLEQNPFVSSERYQICCVLKLFMRTRPTCSHIAAWVSALRTRERFSQRKDAYWRNRSLLFRDFAIFWRQYLGTIVWKTSL